MLCLAVAACVCESTRARGSGILYGIGVTRATSKVRQMTPRQAQI